MTNKDNEISIPQDGLIALLNKEIRHYKGHPNRHNLTTEKARARRKGFIEGIEYVRDLLSNAGRVNEKIEGVRQEADLHEELESEFQRSRL